MRSCALFVSSLTGVDFPFVSVKLKVAEGGLRVTPPVALSCTVLPSCAVCMGWSPPPPTLEFKVYHGLFVYREKGNDVFSSIL